MFLLIKLKVFNQLHQIIKDYKNHLIKLLMSIRELYNIENNISISS